jgi:hypothetical protein
MGKIEGDLLQAQKRNSYPTLMTYEMGNGLGEYMYDIFNDNGVFIGRKSLNLGRQQYFPKINYAKIKRGLLYRYHEKENGFDELLVRQVVWKD